MRLLIDSHVLLWWWTEERSLSPAALSLVIDPAASILVSAVSAWEIATKHRLGKLPQLDGRFTDLRAGFLDELVEDRFELMPITAEHGLRAGSYDLPHRDPFDRLLAAQSEVEDVPLITRDPAFAAFPCETIW